MNLKGYERKRYKEHPSFTIALTAIDVYYESTFFKKYNSTISILKLSLKYFDRAEHDAADTEEYFEISHGCPHSQSLARRQQSKRGNSLHTWSRLNQSRLEFESLSESFAMNRVIHDGSKLSITGSSSNGLSISVLNLLVNYPIHELKSLIKGAAYNTFR